MSTTIDINKLSPEEFEALQQQIKEKQEQERETREKEKREYQRKRNTIIKQMCKRAQELSSEIHEFKEMAFSDLIQFKELMLSYGVIRNGKDNKGNFEILSEDKLNKVQFTTSEVHAFDERSKLAENHLKSFLEGFVKKRDLVAYQLVMSLLERNKRTGQLDISNINRLYQLENDFDDEDWKLAISLFKESYVHSKTSVYARFYARENENAPWQLINLNFSSAR